MQPSQTQVSPHTVVSHNRNSVHDHKLVASGYTLLILTYCHYIVHTKNHTYFPLCYHIRCTLVYTLNKSYNYVFSIFDLLWTLHLIIVQFCSFNFFFSWSFSLCVFCLTHQIIFPFFFFFNSSAWQKSFSFLTHTVENFSLYLFFLKNIFWSSLTFSWEDDSIFGIKLCPYANIMSSDIFFYLCRAFVVQIMRWDSYNSEEDQPDSHTPVHRYERLSVTQVCIRCMAIWKTEMCNKCDTKRVNTIEYYPFDNNKTWPLCSWKV